MWALLPIRSFDAAKSRLAPILSGPERSDLARAMAEDVLSVLCACAGIEAIAVCSPDPEAAALARRYGCHVIDEAEDTGLDRAVRRAAAILKERGARDLMVVHGDLPLLGAGDLDGFLAAYENAGPGPRVVIAPDRQRDGSNLLAWPLDLAFRTAYGPGSFSRHLQEAARLGALTAVRDLPGAAADIDNANDLIHAIEAGARCGPRTRHFLDALTKRRGLSKTAGALFRQGPEDNGEPVFR